jgi:HSP20 family protein
MLAKWSPFDELTRFERKFDRLFAGHSFSPAVDVYEDKEKITVEAEVPGMEEKDVEITVDKNVLSIKGSRQLEKKADKKEYWRVERSSGSFVRSFTLPSSVETENIQASYNKGVLTIHIPKKPEVVPRKIEIKSTG